MYTEYLSQGALNILLSGDNSEIEDFLSSNDKAEETRLDSCTVSEYRKLVGT